MSTDAIADALLNACESSIKSLAQFLTSLHSIDALPRLKEKADVIEAFIVIASFAQVVVPTHPAAPAPLTTVDVDESLAEGRVERFERRAEILECDRLAVAGGHKEDMSAFTPILALAHPSTLEDGRDDDVPQPLSQSTLRHLPIHPLPLDDYSDLLHWPRPSPTNLDAWKLGREKTKPLYSILVYFPILTYRQMWVTGKERDMLSRIIWPSSDVDGASTESHLFSTEIYPRIRLLDEATRVSGTQNVALILDDNPGRLRAAQMRLLAAQRSYWGDSQSSSPIKDQASIFVRTWEERPSILVFTYSKSTPNATRNIKEIRQDPAMLARAVFERYPVLTQFQPLTDCHFETGDGSSLCRLLGGGGRVYYSPATVYHGGHSREECHTLFVPLFPGTSCREAFGRSNGDLEDFCEDFASEKSPFVFDKSLEFVTTCHTLRDPLLPSSRLRWS